MNVIVETGIHTQEIPRGMEDTIESGLEPLSEYIREDETVYAQLASKVKSSSHTVAFHPVRILSGNTIECRVKPGDNGTAHLVRIHLPNTVTDVKEAFALLKSSENKKGKK